MSGNNVCNNRTQNMTIVLLRVTILLYFYLPLSCEAPFSEVFPNPCQRSLPPPPAKIFLQPPPHPLSKPYIFNGTFFFSFSIKRKSERKITDLRHFKITFVNFNKVFLLNKLLIK